jgi:hypothetical protein
MQDIANTCTRHNPCHDRRPTLRQLRRLPDPVAVPMHTPVVGQARDGEVLPEPPIWEVATTQLGRQYR